MYYTSNLLDELESHDEDVQQHHLGLLAGTSCHSVSEVVVVLLGRIVV